MKERLFRAKRKDTGEWIEGYFVSVLPVDMKHAKPKAVIFPKYAKCNWFNKYFYSAVEVDPETVTEVCGGEWIEGAEHFTNGLYEAECSVCGNYIRWNEGNSGEWNYCPNCGAKMDGGGDG